MNDALIQFLVSKLGGKLIGFITILVAAAVMKISASVPFLAPFLIDPSNQAMIVTTIWGLLMVLVNYVTNHWLTQYAKDIQTALNKTGSDLKVDGWIGDKTMVEFNKIVNGDTSVPSLSTNPPQK